MYDGKVNYSFYIFISIVILIILLSIKIIGFYDIKDESNKVQANAISKEEELPNKKVVVISPNPIATMSKNNVNLTYEDYTELTAERLEKSGYFYIDIYKEMIHYIRDKHEDVNDYLADKIHPNERGY